MLKGKMTTEAIPERVYELCKLLQCSSMSNREAKGLMEPNASNSTSQYFNFYRECAVELGLIEEVSNSLSITPEGKKINTMKDFRLHVIKNLHHYYMGDFYKVTKNFYSLNLDYVSKKINSLSSNEFVSIVKGESECDTKGIRGWRFWLSFLGLADLSTKDKMFCVPNAYRYLNDVLEIAEFENDRVYSMNEFMDKIQDYIYLIQDISDRNLNFGFSTGLRLLEKKNKIELGYEMDADPQKVWHLYPLKMLSQNQVSYIKYKG